jgi:curli biogenesis system outer membrane secretion channel CsgG
MKHRLSQFVVFSLLCSRFALAQSGLPPLPPLPGQQGLPVQPGMPMQPQPAATGPITLPHSGNLMQAPNSAASKRFTDRPTVTIREFRSSVAEITPRGATDMFMTALVKSRKFRVVERARMADGIAAEKALNQAGMTTGQTGQAQYVGAAYYFEATISESATGEQKNSLGIGLAGAAASKTWTTDSISIDVRVVDVESGIVVDAVEVTRKIEGEESKVGGVTTALANLFTRGRAGAIAQALAPSDEASMARKDSVDRALRNAIEEAVKTLAQRFSE